MTFGITSMNFMKQMMTKALCQESSAHPSFIYFSTFVCSDRPIIIQPDVTLSPHLSQ